MPIWLKNVCSMSGDVVVTDIPNGHPITIHELRSCDVDLEVGGRGVEIKFDDGKRVMKITDSDYKLTFKDEFLNRQVVFTIIDTWFQGAATFNVKIGPQDVTIMNNDLRLYYKGHSDAAGDHPRSEYHINTEIIHTRTYTEKEKKWVLK